MLDLDNLMSPGEIAGLIGVTESRLARWRSKGVGPSYVKLEKKILYPRDRLVEFLNASMIMTRNAAILNQPEYE